VPVRKLNLDGEPSSDLTAHGGVDKAVYVYPSEHYAFWRGELPNVDLPRGAFGENFTIEGSARRQSRSYRRPVSHWLGTVRCHPTSHTVLQAGHPIRPGRYNQRFLHSGRNAFYFSVAEEGEVAASDTIELVASDENAVTVADIVELYTADAANQDLLHRVSELAALPESWRAYFRKRLRKVPHAVDPKPLVLASNSALSWTPFRIHPRAFAPSYGQFLSS
jgi:MOSC domain-containing protein YiiM